MILILILIDRREDELVVLYLRYKITDNLQLKLSTEFRLNKDLGSIYSTEDFMFLSFWSSSESS